jgi:hypothetical protein
MAGMDDAGILCRSLTLVPAGHRVTTHADVILGMRPMHLALLAPALVSPPTYFLGQFWLELAGRPWEAHHRLEGHQSVSSVG